MSKKCLSSKPSCEEGQRTQLLSTLPITPQLGQLGGKRKGWSTLQCLRCKDPRASNFGIFTTGVGILFIKEGQRVTKEPGRSESWMQWAQAGTEVETGDAMTGTAGCIKPDTSTKAQVLVLTHKAKREEFTQ